MAENNNRINVDKIERPPLKKHDIKMLDIAFAMDCTGSMGSYIDSARDNIRKIVEEIVASEKSNVHLALVEYRDHPPQESTFVTQVHDFTASPKTMKDWLSNCQATGGGDTPEAVSDALHDVLKLSWREEATKICVCISDAPPHGINAGGDGFPDGCPAGIDPMDVTNRMAEKGITLYMVGCEPSITPYKDFFMAIAFITGGQYVPLTKAQLLTQVIVGGAQEEMSLEQFMDEVNEEAQADLAAGREINEEEFTRRVHSKMMSKGIRTKQLHRNNAELSSAAESPGVKQLANFKNLSDVRKNFKPDGHSHRFGAPMGRMGAPMGRMASCAAPLPPALGGAPPLPTFEGAPPPPAPLGGTPMAGLYASHAPMGAEMEAERYETVESDISYAQSSRMVQKCLKRNMIKK